MMLESKVLMILLLWVVGMLNITRSFESNKAIDFGMGAAALMLAMWIGYTL